MRRHAKASSAGSGHGRAATKPLIGIGVALLASLAFVALSAAPAFAAPVYVPAGSLDGSATANGSFAQLLSESVAVNGKNGHILVADSGLGLVYDYDSLADASPATWDGSTTPAGSFGGGRVAVAADDSSGDVYVLDSTGGLVSKFDETGTLIASFGDSSPSADGQLAGTATPAASFEGPLGIAVDQESGDLYVIDSGHGVVDVFDSTGAYLSQFDGSATAQGFFSGSYADGIAVNDANSHVYVSDSQSVQAFEFDLAGNFLADWNGAGTPAGSFGGGYTTVAAANASGQVYVADTSSGVVDAFDQSGLYLRQVSGAGEPRGIAVEQASGKLYVSDNSTGTVRVFELANVEPPSVSIDPVTTFTATTAQLSGEIDPNGATAPSDTSWHFECTPSCGSPSGEDVKADGAAHTVEAEATGLQPHTTYTVKLIASNAGGQGEAAEIAGEPVEFTTEPVAPQVGHTFVTEVGTTQAKLNAQVNPGGAETTYHFEYVTEAHFQAEGFSGATSTTPDVLAGEDNAEHLASTAVSGLTEDTAYRYRAVAVNSIDSVEGPIKGLHTAAIPAEPQPDSCPNAQFRAEQHATFLPDCRAYEQVSPVDKNGADVIPNETRTRLSPDGSRVLFSSLGGFADPSGVGLTNDYLSVRDPDTALWTTHSITPPQGPNTFFEAGSGVENFYLDASEDLTAGVLTTRSPLTDAPNVAGAVNLYRRDDLLAFGKGSYQLLTDSTTPQPQTKFDGSWKPQVAAASADFSQVLFESQRNLTDETVACTESSPDGSCIPLLYEATEGITRFVGWVPATPGATECVGVAPDCVVPAGGAQAGRGALKPALASDAFSQDGSRVIFTVPTAPRSPEGKLFLRDDQGTASVADDATVQIDAPFAGPSTYWAATPDADRIFFTNGGNAYRYDVDAAPGDHLTLLSSDSEPADGVSPDVEGIIGASDDGSYVYLLTAGNQLVLGGPTGSVGGPGASKRIFVWHEGVIREVGGVNDTDFEDVLGLRNPRLKVSRLTPDGTRLAFVSRGTNELLSLYGQPEYDHAAAPTCDGRGRPCSEVYLYDATGNGGAGELRCVSCNPSGAAATHDASMGGILGGSGAVDTTYQNHPLSSDGRYVFFSTAERLLERDTNGVLDAYEYDAVSGRLHLISTGADSDRSAFIDASPDGSSVLFATRQQLRATDTDGARDLYLARTGGGSADPIAPSLCDPTGGSCQGPAGAPPPAGSPGSVNPSGPGNVPRRKRCHRGKHLVRHGVKARCVKNRPKRHQANTNRRTSR